MSNYTVAIPEKLMDRIDEYNMKSDLGFSTKSEIIKHIIREFLKAQNGGCENCRPDGNKDVRKNES